MPTKENPVMKYWLLATFAVFSAHSVAEFQFSGQAEIELRGFPQKGLLKQQKQAYLSLALQPRIDWQNEQQDQRIRIEPFVRASAPDGNRTHTDLREAYYQFSGQHWQLKTGISTVFWGVAESLHLVDVINQADIAESPVGKEKLGQPMINLGFEHFFGNLDFYILPYFRSRHFASDKERFQISPGVQIDPADLNFGNIDRLSAKYHHKKAFYQSRHKESHVDTAIRWNHYIDNFDFALSAFNGTSREAIPVLYGIESGNNALTGKFASWYEQTTRIGLEAQYLHYEWAFKLESAYHRQASSNYTATVIGTEYTFSDIGQFGSDIGLLAEYLWHDRKNISIKKPTKQVLDESLFGGLDNLGLFDQYKIPSDYLTPFDNDIFLGTRFSLNNVASTQFLAGVIIDADDQTVLGSFEGSTRIGDSVRLSMNLYLSKTKEKTSTFYPFRKDNMLELKANWYF